MLDFEAQTHLLAHEQERLTSAQQTIAYWRQAHDDNTPYHQRYPGYCWFCTNLPIDYLRQIPLPTQ